MALTRVGSKGLAPGAVDPNDIAANAITEAKIADGAVTPNKISGEVPVTKGGTGVASLTANAVLLGNGTSAVATVSAGDTGNVLTSDGTAWISKAISAGGNLVSSIFTSPGTWDANVKIAAGLKAVKVTVVGAGGGVAIYNGTSAGAPAGGTTSFGTLASATGGAGGVITGSTFTYGTGGVGTTNVTSNVNISGGTACSRGFVYDPGTGATTISSGSSGGSSLLGGNSAAPTRTAAASGFGVGASGIGPSITCGGGGGGASIIYLTAPEIPGPVSVTIGTGGTRITTGPAPQQATILPSGEALGGNGIVVVEEFY